MNDDARIGTWEPKDRMDRGREMVVDGVLP